MTAKVAIRAFFFTSICVRYQKGSPLFLLILCGFFSSSLFLDPFDMPSDNLVLASWTIDIAMLSSIWEKPQFMRKEPICSTPFPEQRMSSTTIVPFDQMQYDRHKSLRKQHKHRHTVILQTTKPQFLFVLVFLQ